MHRTVPVATRALQPSQQLRESLAEGACERRNRVEPGLGAPALYLDNRVLGEPAMDREIGKAPAVRFAKPFDALAEPYLERLWYLSHSYRFSGTAPNRDPTILVCIPLIWYYFIGSYGRDQRTMVPAVRRHMQTGERPSSRAHSGLPMVRLSAGFSARNPRHGNVKASLRVATKWLGTSLVDLLLDISLVVHDGRGRPCRSPATTGQPPAGGHHD